MGNWFTSFWWGQDPEEPPDPLVRFAGTTNPTPLYSYTRVVGGEPATVRGIFDRPGPGTDWTRFTQRVRTHHDTLRAWALGWYHRAWDDAPQMILEFLIMGAAGSVAWPIGMLMMISLFRRVYLNWRREAEVNAANLELSIRRLNTITRRRWAKHGQIRRRLRVLRPLPRRKVSSRYARRLVTRRYVIPCGSGQHNVNPFPTSFLDNMRRMWQRIMPGAGRPSEEMRVHEMTTEELVPDPDGPINTEPRHEERPAIVIPATCLEPGVEPLPDTDIRVVETTPVQRQSGEIRTVSSADWQTSDIEPTPGSSGGSGSGTSRQLTFSTIIEGPSEKIVECETLCLEYMRDTADEEENDEIRRGIRIPTGRLHPIWPMPTEARSGKTPLARVPGYCWTRYFPIDRQAEAVGVLGPWPDLGQMLALARVWDIDIHADNWHLIWMDSVGLAYVSPRALSDNIPEENAVPIGGHDWVKPCDRAVPIACRPPGWVEGNDLVYATDHQVRQRIGTWTWDPCIINGFEQQGMMHDGDYDEPENDPRWVGWCFLLIFKKRYQRVVETHLDWAPWSEDLYKYAMTHQRWLETERCIKIHLPKLGVEEGTELHRTHLALHAVVPSGRGLWARPREYLHTGKLMNGLEVALFLQQYRTRVAGETYGYPTTSWIGTPDAKEWPVEEYKGFPVAHDTKMAHPEEPKGRSPASPHPWHLLPEVWEACRMSEGEAGIVPELVTGFAMAEHYTRKVIQGWDVDDAVLVTAANSDDQDWLGEHPSKIIPRATRGLVYCLGTKAETVKWVQTREPLGDHWHFLCPWCGAEYNTEQCDLEVALDDHDNHSTCTVKLQTGEYEYNSSMIVLKRPDEDDGWRRLMAVRGIRLDLLNQENIRRHKDQIYRIGTEITRQKAFHDAWDVIYLHPLRKHPRALATIRLLPVVMGREDVDVCIMNGRNKPDPRDGFEFIKTGGPAYYSKSRSWCICDLGSFFATSGVFGADMKHFMNLFIRYGDVYGADEGFLLRRNPIFEVRRGLDPRKEWVFNVIRERAVYERVTIIELVGGWHKAWYFPTLTLDKLIEFYYGARPIEPEYPPPPLVESGAVSYQEAKRRALEACRIRGIPPLCYTGKYHPRRGVRCPRVVYDSTPGIGNRNGCVIPGCIWRRCDTMFGLRNCLDPRTTQALPVELFVMTRGAKFDADPELIEILEKVIEDCEKYLDSFKAGSVIFVASVWSPKMQNDFRVGRGHLCQGWIWLTEGRTLTAEKNEVVFTLPTTLGTPYIFQLSRLLPYAGRYRADIYISCINDLETDWYPREVRLAVGRDCMRTHDLVFPAQDFNCPNPFQDVYGRAGALREHRKNLVASIAEFGWIYGYDEVWCNSWGFPTAGVVWKLGGAAIPTFKIPYDCPLLEVTTNGVVERIAKNGNLMQGMKEAPTCTRLQCDRLPSLETIPEGDVEVASWRQHWRQILLEGYNSGVMVMVLFLWGTRGDRVPMRAAAKVMRQLGAKVLLVSLCSEEEGRQGLEKCENERGYELVPELMEARCIIQDCPVPNLASSYFGVNRGSLGVVLRPPDDESTRPRGGLPWWCDWIVPFVNWEAEDIWVAKTDRYGYFPRSADGERFLKAQKNFGTYEKGVVLGSSTIPVPDKYLTWPVVPPGDHMELLRHYKRIACAGGSGVVQTARAAGVEIVETWTDVIDRQWLDPMNAGKPVTKDYSDNWWWFPVIYFYPRCIRYFWCRPRLLYGYIYWRLGLVGWWRNLWALLFLAYCARANIFIMPTWEATFSRIAMGPGSGIATVLLGKGIAVGLRTYKHLRGVTWAHLFYEFTLLGLATVMDPMFTWLTSAGCGWRMGFVGALLWSRAPSISDLIHKFRWGKMHAYTGGIWLGITPVFANWVPVGLHALIYDASEGVLYQGRHVGETSLRLGGAFTFTKEKKAMVNTAVWVKTELTRQDLEKYVEVTRPYSMFWNCQVQAAMILLSSSGQISLLTLLVITIGFISATLGLVLATCIIGIAGSASLTAIFFVTPEAIVRKERLDLMRSTMHGMLAIVPWFAAPNENDDDDIRDDGIDDISSEELFQLRHYCAKLAAMGLADGIPQDVVFEAMGRTVAIVAGAGVTTDFGKHRAELVDAMTDSHRKINNLSTRIVTELTRIGIPLRLIEAIARVLMTIGEGTGLVCWLGVTSIALVIDYVDRHALRPLAVDLREALSVLIELAHNERDRVKNCWTPMVERHFEHLRFADWVSLSLREHMTIVGSGDPIKSMIDRLNAFKPSNEEALDPDIVYRRPVRLPQNPRCSTYELKYPSLLHSVAAIVDPTLQARAEKYERMGGKPGIDGIWLATDEVRHAQLEGRYLAEGKPWTPEEGALLESVVEMLYTQHRTAFEAPGVVPPETVARQLIKKYSPGIPFLPRFKKRSQLWSTGWMDALIQTTYDYLEKGEFPAEVYHAFPKMQIVKKNREITAESLPSVFVAQVAQLEMNKRGFWYQADMGMGAPITARYLGEIFERVNGRKMAFTADATDFDSNCPPILFEGLSRIYERGVKDGGIPAVAEIARAKYMAMQKAIIVDLPTGKIYQKNRGGATGQSATSWDNHWAFRIAMVMSWSYVTGKEPSQFYETNTVHNTGDDNIWGTDDEITPEEIALAAEQLFGMKFKIEKKGQVVNLSYLSRIPVPVERVLEDAEIAGLAGQAFVARPDRERMLLRRSAVLSRYSGAPYRRFYEAQVQRSVGHLQNCQFDRELYSTILREYMEDASNYVGIGPGLIWRVKYDKWGHALAATPAIRNHYRPSQSAEGRFKQLTRAMKAPSYEEVLRIHGKEIDREPKQSKFYAARHKVSFERVLREWVSTGRMWFNAMIPEGLTRLGVEPDCAPIAPLMWTPGWPVEKYIWLDAKRKGLTLSVEQFHARIRGSPFGPATDPNGFWWFTQIPGMEEKLIAENFDVVRGRMIGAMGVFIFFNWMMGKLRTLPIIGLAIEGWLVYQQDLPRLYSALSALHWITNCEVSATVSSLVPKDAHAFQKISAVWTSIVLPDWLCWFLSKIVRKEITSSIIDGIAWMRAFRPFGTMDPAYAPVTRNQWEHVAPELYEAARISNCGIIVMAETATGKSTAFVAALSKVVKGRIWLLVPRIVLRQEYQNPWLVIDEIVKLDRHTIDTGARIAVCTYGHFISRALHAGILTKDDLVLMDEFHENEPDMGICYHGTQVPKILMSATPTTIYATDAPVHTIPIPRPFKEPTPVRLDLPVVAIIQEALRKHAGEQRLLVIVPGVREAEAIATALDSLGRQATVLSGARRAVPEKGDIVATQIVDSGMDIPGITIVIDKGQRVVSDKGKIKVQPSDPSTDKQRRGRTGRRNDGFVYTHLRAGTGTPPTPYPTYTRIMEDSTSRQWLLDKLGIGYDLYPYSVDIRSRIDPRMRLLGDYTRAEEISLSAWWALSCNGVTREEADKTYDSICIYGWDEDSEVIRQLLLRAFGTSDLLSRLTITPILMTTPFEVVYKAVPRRTYQVRIEDGEFRVL
nr:putative polyprotein [Red mite associated hypovirus 1]